MIRISIKKKIRSYASTDEAHGGVGFPFAPIISNIKVVRKQFLHSFGGYEKAACFQKKQWHEFCLIEVELVARNAEQKKIRKGNKVFIFSFNVRLTQKLASYVFANYLWPPLEHLTLKYLTNIKFNLIKTYTKDPF